MSRLNRIQLEIEQIDGGRFQKLCDTYLYRKRNWENIVSLGSMEGKDKPTRGIPDTYYHDAKSNSYILIMYSTRKDATTKLVGDIKDAIGKTNIDEKDIKEIICCHTSSNITVEKDKELKELASPVELTLIGIDTLSQDLLEFKYQDIVKDNLGIVESTEQVWSLENFISIHDKSKTNAPLITPYIDENNTIQKLMGELNDYQILLLSGVPGAGKTRLAIELCKKLSEQSDVKNNIICVKSNSLPAYQDIKDALDDKEVNYLFLDDANQITNFDAIINLLSLKEYEKRLKLIITIRDYAFSEISGKLKSFETKIHKTTLMSDENIEILVNSIDIIPSRKLRKLIALSHNNPRVAVIAAIMAKDHNYEFVDSGEDILDDYYTQIIKENCLSEDEKVSFFILSLKHKIDLTNREPLEELLKFCKIDFDIFLESIKQLHGKELCDIFLDKAVKVTDQSLSDFLIIDFIVNNKIFRIRDFFISLFPKYAKEIVEMLVMVNNFKFSSDWIEYLKSEIKYVYNEIILDIDKERFLIQYGALIPIEGLAYTYKKIKFTNNVEYQACQKEFEEKKRSQNIDDPIITIICSLSNSEKVNDSGTLLIEYLKKRQDKVYEVFSAIKLNFDLEVSWNAYLEKRFIIFEIFLDQENINELTALLIVNIAEDFLKFHDERSSFNNKKFIINHYTLIDGDYLIELHKKILDMLIEVYKLKYIEVNNYIDKLLFNYPIYEIKNGFLKTISSDIEYIRELFFKDLRKLDFRQEAIVFKLDAGTKKLNLESQPFFDYELSDRQTIYNTFSSNMLYAKEELADYETIKKLKIDNLNEIFRKYFNDLLELFNILWGYRSDELLNKNELEESMRLLYSHLSIEHKVKMLKYLLSSEYIPSDYYFDDYMKNLPYEEGKNILSCFNKELDEKWYISNLLTCKKINNEMIEELTKFLENLRDYGIMNHFNILSFEGYIKQYTTILDVLMSKYRKGEISKVFFIPNYVTEEEAEKIIDMVGYKELKVIYLDSSYSEAIDYSGEVFKRLLTENDPNFIYLFLKKLNNEWLELNVVERGNKLKYIWISTNAETGIKKYLDFLISENRVIYFGVNQYLEEIFKGDIERSLKFIQTEVTNTHDDNILVNLYNLSLAIFEDKILLDLFELIKDKEIEDTFFEKLYLTMRINSWSGSLVPYLDKEIGFLFNLRDIFKDIKYISYALFIENQIDSLKKRKEKELFLDYFEG